MDTSPDVPLEARVKEEPEWDASGQEASETLPHFELYIKHEVKDDMVIGPEGLQPADSAFAVHGKLECPDTDEPAYLSVHREHIFTECHIAQEPEKPNTEKCLECGKQFKTKSSLNKHIKLHSQKERKGADAPHTSARTATYNCQFCKKTFRSVTQLITHEHTHDKYAFSCDMCSKPFAQRKTLEKHMQVHMGISPSVHNPKKKQPKTNAQRAKEYRERIKMKRLAEILDKKKIAKSDAKSNAIKCKEYRDRQKIKKLTERLNELRVPKTDAQKAREYRERLKLKRLAGTPQMAKSNAQACKQYRHKQKIKILVTQLKQEKCKLNDISQKTDNSERDAQMVDESSDGTKIKGLPELKQDKDSTDHLNRSESQTQNNPEKIRTFGTYLVVLVQSNCARPNAFYAHDTEIPSDENSLFNSVIKTMKLSTTPAQMRRQLLDSEFINSCVNPDRVKSVLNSETERADIDCVYLLARVYNQNICVHVNVKENYHYHHFTVNDTRFVHLHLDGGCFTPLIQNVDSDDDVTKMSVEDDVDDEANVSNVDDATNFKVDVNIPIYTNYYEHANGHLQFHKMFKNNTFGHACAVCDRLWWEKNIKTSSHDILKDLVPDYVPGTNVAVCMSCKNSVDKGKIPLLSKYNGFAFPTIPQHLPKLNLIEKRLISPKIPFTQIMRITHVNGNYIHGQIINVPLELNKKVKKLPRNIEDDHSIYVNTEKKIIYTNSDICALINKDNIEQWLKYLVKTPLYLQEDIKISKLLLKSYEGATKLDFEEVREHVIEDSYTAQQTVMLNEDDVLKMAPSKKRSVPSDKYAEELSFPTIYGGEFRTYKSDIGSVSTFIQTRSELRRKDRRAADPQHILYVAAKIMKQRVNQFVREALKCVGYNTQINIDDLQSDTYVNSCVESYLAFLRCIPNSAWYWADQKNFLLSMIRQYGIPTAYMKLSANETGWTDLLKLLYKLSHNADIDDASLSEMTYVEKVELVNGDAVTCTVYYNQLVNCLLSTLQKKKNPYGRYLVKNYYKKIEFHQGRPEAHIFLWLDNVPQDIKSKEFIAMADYLVSVSAVEASGNIKLQTHNHTISCKMDGKDCKFGAPYLPSRETVTLTPMNETDDDYSEAKFKEYNTHYESLRRNLECKDYDDFEQFYAQNSIESDEHYYKVIRAGITQPMLLHQRKPSEKWHESFNPFIFHHLQAKMDFRIILNEHDFASYINEYTNRHKRGISELRQQIIDIIDENPGCDIGNITKKLSVDLVKAVEMSVQEAAWYVLSKPMAQASVVSAYIPTIYPTERQRIGKKLNELNYDEDSDICQDDWIDKYEKRPETLSDVTLAQFVANYTVNKKRYIKRKVPRLIRYRNYDVKNNFNDHKREMVLLHIPFRSEEKDILADFKFFKIYDDNKDLIEERRKEFQFNADIEKILDVYRQLPYRHDTPNSVNEG